MEEKKKATEPLAPGIPDALHPEIGNGALFTHDPNSRNLRSPDPLKHLDAWLTTHPPEVEDTPISMPPTSLPSDTKPSSQKAKRVQPRRETESTNTPPALPDQPARKQVQRAVKRKAKAEDKPKPPKPGKRLRKAAKAVQKQEEKARSVGETAEPILPDSTLSPFTQWLKNLSGSEYVHPYDDDFAIEQSSGPAREGISETYADLLASQGHTERAKEMYMRLMEKYPEKSGFFAAKIKALE